jgi:predicted deacylase
MGRFGNDEAGPRMIVTGGIHGNEPAGLVAIERVMQRLDRFVGHLPCGGGG